MYLEYVQAACLVKITLLKLQSFFQYFQISSVPKTISKNTEKYHGKMLKTNKSMKSSIMIKKNDCICGIDTDSFLFISLLNYSYLKIDYNINI